MKFGSISGSLTRLVDDTSYLIAGANVTITSESNGAVTISSTGGGGGSTDDFFDSSVAGSIFTSGSTAFVGVDEFGVVTSPTDKAADVFFYVSGSIGSKHTSIAGTALFGGDVTVSGSFYTDGNVLEVQGKITATEGISGSLTQLTDGTSYLIAGTNISITSQSNGAITISNSLQQTDDFFDSTIAGSIFTTGSTAFKGQESISSPVDKGTDVFFYVSGSAGSKGGTDPGTAVFEGDVVISGSVYSGGNKFEMTGTLEVTNGISGSLTNLVDGTSYLIAGNNIGVVSQSNGPILISAIPGGSNTHIQYNDNNTFGSISYFRIDTSVSPPRVTLDGRLATGRTTTAIGSYAHAQGQESDAIGSYSHAEGYNAQALGSHSHAEGNWSEAFGSYSHAQGDHTIASGTYQSAVGAYNKRDNDHSLLVIGNGTGDDNSVRSDIVRVEMDSVQITGSLYQRNSGSSTIGFMGDDPSMIPADKGTDIFFYVSGSTAASRSDVSLFGGHVFISGSMIQGNFDVSGGTTARYARSHGERTSATGTASHSEGRFVVAQGSWSHAEGDSTFTGGQASHAEGLDSATYANYSHAEGRSTEARGVYSHAEGYDSIPRADYSHAEGRDTETIIGALYSHAEGSGSITVGIASHAGGLCTIASGSNQTVFGQYNLRDNPDSLFVIGNGISDNNSDRSDVIRVQPGTLGSGQLQVSGSMSVSGSYSGNTNTLSGPGTIGSAGHSTLLTCTGVAEAITLVDGTWLGQLKYVVANSGYGAGNSSIITPTNALGYTSVTFDSNGEALTLFWTGSKWVIVGSYGATITP
jgi:hypothetical protein